MTNVQPANPTAVDEVNNTSIELWYVKVASAMKKSEVKPGSYVTNMCAADTGSTVLSEGERGAVSIKAFQDGMVSLDNSNIYFEQKLKITVPSQENSYVNEYYVGYKDIAGIIYQYLIVSNADKVQNKVHTEYEWFLKSISKLTAAMANNNSDAILSKIRNRNDNVPGIYVNVAGITEETIMDIVLNLKVPVTRFLILNDLQWIADWMGTWTIEMWLSMRNIVVAPVIPEALFTKFPEIQAAIDAVNNADP